MSDKDLDELVTNALKSGEWIEYKDEKTGRPYYTNKARTQSTWDLKKLLMKGALEKREKKGESDSVKPMSEGFLCPITQEIMKDPVIDPHTGHSYERTAIESWIKKMGTSPMTRLPLKMNHLIPNRSLRIAIEDIQATVEAAAKKAAKEASVKKAAEEAAAKKEAVAITKYWNYKARATAIYLTYAPDKVGRVDAAMKAYAGQEEVLIEALVAKYGPEPEDDRAPLTEINRNYKAPHVTQ